MRLSSMDMSTPDACWLLVPVQLEPREYGVLRSVGSSHGQLSSRANLHAGVDFGVLGIIYPHRSLLVELNAYMLLGKILIHS